MWTVELNVDVHSEICMLKRCSKQSGEATSGNNVAPAVIWGSAKIESQISGNRLIKRWLCSFGVRTRQIFDTFLVPSTAQSKGTFLTSFM